MVYFGFTSTDAYFNSIGHGKILLNNFSSVTSAEDIDKHLLTTYSDGTFDNIPQCNCGLCDKAYMENRICPNCDSKVESIFKKKEPLVWFKKYEEVEKFISPHFWLCLRENLSTKIDMLRWLSDTKYNPPVDIPDWIKTMVIKLDYKRGYSSLVQNLDRILEFCISHPNFRNKNKYQELEIWLDIWNNERGVILNNYMGLFNKSLFVIEETKMGNYTDLILGEVKAIAYNYLLNNNSLTSLEKKENIMSRLIHGMANITQNYLVKNLQGKYGDFRKHFSGARMPFTFRAVIRSFKGDTRDSIHLPWSSGISTFRLHLLNLLVNRFNFSVKKANMHLYNHAKKYCPTIDECFKILIRESPFGGIPITFTRNPSLPMGSTQYKIITDIKSDVRDNTISISNLTLRPYNADYDGDQMMGLLMLDNHMARLAQSMKVHHSIPGDKRPGDISSTAGLPSPTVMTLTNFSHKCKDEVDIDTDFIDLIKSA